MSTEATLKAEKSSLRKKKKKLADEVDALKKKNSEDEKLKEEYVKMKPLVESVEEDLKCASKNVSVAMQSFVKNNSGSFVNSRKPKMSKIHTQINMTYKDVVSLKNKVTTRITDLEDEIEGRKKDIKDKNDSIDKINAKIKKINSKLNLL